MVKKVLLGGCFDLLHRGHIEQIKKAKELGDYLIINLSSDKQVKKKKGNGRPVIPENDRKEMLLALRYVDEVICMDTEELNLPLLLEIAKPDILIANKGNNDYDKICKKYNVKIIKLDRCETGLDTSKIINKIKGGK
jgi:D-beta-D-heptose 7-phosphate kinase/D-beta-D-heptose 1-phosphate adenosyltransferase